GSAMRRYNSRMSASETDRMLMDYGFQYYVAARYAVRARLSPVAGNQFHHAIELFLKARVSQSMSSTDMKKKFRHDLKALWIAFKSEFPLYDLTRFDQAIEEVDQFETIRYPDEIIKKGTELVIALDRAAAAATGSIGGTQAPPRYALAMAD